MNKYVTGIVASLGVVAAAFFVAGPLFSLSPAEKKLVVIIPSYNNKLWYEKNLSSIFAQKNGNKPYNNWSIIYVDDCSNDGQYEGIQKFVAQSGYADRCKLVRNTWRRGALANIYGAVLECPNDAVVLLVDGDDWLAHDHVFERVNKEYQNSDVWMTYGQDESFPEGNGHHSQPFHDWVVQNNAYRQAFIGRNCILSATHLRTCYAWLFKQVNVNDLLHEGKFYTMAWDGAFMLPMLEMAGSHARFIPEVLYIYNMSNPINDFKRDIQLLMTLAREIGNSKSYQRLNEPKINQIGDNVDVVAFSYNRPLQLYALLESMQAYLKGMGVASVIYRASNEQFEQGYEQVKKDFPTFKFFKQDNQHAAEDFKSLVMKATFETPNEHIIFAVDDDVVKDFVDLRACTVALEKTKAYGFYLRMGEHITDCYMQRRSQKVPPLQSVGDGVYAWLFGQGDGDWAYPNSVDLTIYRKKDIKADFERIAMKNPNSLEGIWSGMARYDRIGLCFNTAKIVNIPLNLVQNTYPTNRHMGLFTPEQLLEKFVAGLKIDVRPLFKIHNASPQMEYNPNFVAQKFSEQGSVCV